MGGVTCKASTAMGQDAIDEAFNALIIDQVKMRDHEFLSRI